MIANFPSFLPNTVSLDLTLSPLYRIHGQEAPALPGLLALAPPRKTARGREQDRLVLYLLLTGNATFSSAEYTKLAEDAGATFHQTAGPLTSALRAVAGFINQTLLDRNLSTSGRGQYAIGWLALMAVRDTQCTFLLSGPMHAYLLGQEARHIFEPGLSGKGLGVGQAVPHYFTQTTLAPNDRILLTGKVPAAWESTLATPGAASLEATRRRLLTLTTEDLHSVLMQATPGAGGFSVLQRTAPTVADVPHEEAPAPLPAEPTPTPASTESLPPSEPAESAPEPQSTEPEPQPAESYPAHMVGPSAYAIPNEEAASASKPVTRPLRADDFPASIPRAKPKAADPLPAAEPAVESAPEPEPESVEAEAPVAPRPRRRHPSRAAEEASPILRQTAKLILGAIEGGRRLVRRSDEGLRKFLPRLLPGNEAGETRPLPDATLLFLALVIPLIIGTLGLMAYFRFGVSQQYDTYLAQAYNARKTAASQTDPVMQSNTWSEVLLYVDKAESYRKTDETRMLREEANGKLDQLQGVRRLKFQAAFSNGLGIEISRMAATESDLYLLDAKTGEELRASISANGNFQIDKTFNCKPGEYGSYKVGPLQDILAMPLMNMANATLLGVDRAGNLLYCAPNQVPVAKPLPAPNTNWGLLKAVTLDSGNLYALDSPANAVWVYTGKDSEFVDLPYFFFSSQVPSLQDGIDLAVRADELYVLHADGHLTRCSYSRLDVRPTTCQELTLVNPFPALRDSNLFAQAHFTQMIYTVPPDPTILLLDADNQVVMRLSPTSLELQNQFRPVAGSVPSGFIGAMTTSPNHILFLAVGDQVYYTTEMP